MRGSCHLDRAGHWMLKLVSNIERFLLLCFLNFTLRCILGHLQDIEKVEWFQKKNIAEQFVVLLFDPAKNKKVNKHFKISTPVANFEIDDPYINCIFFNFVWCFRLPTKVRWYIKLCFIIFHNFSSVILQYNWMNMRHIYIILRQHMTTDLCFLPVLMCCDLKIVLHWYENQNKNNFVITCCKSW